jgi:hypothetical protein
MSGVEVPDTKTIEGIADYLSGKEIDAAQEILENIAKLFEHSEPAEECPTYGPSTGPYSEKPLPNPRAQPGQPGYIPPVSSP